MGRGTNQPGFSTVSGVHVIYWILYIVYCLHLLLLTWKTLFRIRPFSSVLAPVPYQNRCLLLGQVKRVTLIGQMRPSKGSMCFIKGHIELLKASNCSIQKWSEPNIPESSRLHRISSWAGWWSIMAGVYYLVVIWSSVRPAPINYSVNNYLFNDKGIRANVGGGLWWRGRGRKHEKTVSS